MGRNIEMVMRLVVSLILVINLSSRVNGDDDGNFMVGVGIADVTGPSADIGMMGYASLDQTAQGIHTRLFSRAFVFESDGQRVVYVSADIGMVDQAIKTEVVNELRKQFGELYTPQNVLLSGTHTHSGPAGYIQYLMYGITSLGFDKPNFRVIVDGMVLSIQRAHKNVQPGRILFNKGELLDANVNRSPSSYRANPEEERAEYEYDVDKDMTLIRIDAEDGKPLGSVNWFAVHPTSMNNTNLLLSGDNKGYASQLFERAMNPISRPGKGQFVAAFGASNLGDVSPNILGPRCIDTGDDCDEETSTCCDAEGNNCFVQKCIAFGPGENMEESTQIIGERQFEEAKDLFDSASEVISGPVQFKHQYVNMSEFEVTIEDRLTGKLEVKKLCKAALGYSFAAGTTDGPGMFDFQQSDTSGSPFWDLIKRFLINPSPEIEECQLPKPILLAVGEAYLPYDWVPSIVETQILRVGNLYIVGVPGELTTMAGRRLRNVIEKMVKDKFPDSPAEPHVVIAGLSNVYTHYITTFEEYQKQRYEAASTLYGPHTLEAYLQHYPRLVENMLNGTDLPIGPTPPNLLDQQFTLVLPPAPDTTPLLHTFGDVLTPPNPIVRPGELVTAVFVAGHPKNDPMREGTFLLVERSVEGQRWETVRTDADWDTKFRWTRPAGSSSKSEAEITWKTPTDILEGFYRIRHFGYHKPGSQEEPRPYQGSTQLFQIVPAGSKPKEHPLWNPKPQSVKRIRTAGDFWNSVSKLAAPSV